MKIPACATLLILGIGLVISGCAPALIAGGAVAGAGTALYVRGEMNTTIDSPYDNVWRATLDGLNDLGMRPTIRDKQANKATIQTRRLDGKTVRIKITPYTKRTTNVSVRVGTFGDEASSKEIMDAIIAQL